MSVQPDELMNRMVPGARRRPALTDRERDVQSLVETYFAIAHEPPSAGWLSRRLSISRQRATELMRSVAEKTRKPRN